MINESIRWYIKKHRSSCYAFICNLIGEVNLEKITWHSPIHFIGTVINDIKNYVNA